MKWSPSLAAYTALGAAVFYSALGCPQNPAEGGSSGGVLRPIDINIPRPSRPVRPLQPPGTDTRHHCHSKRQIPAGSGVVGGVLRPIDINIPRPARPVRPSTSSRISSHRNPQKRQYGVRYGKLGLEGDFEEIYEQTHEGQAAYVYINGPLKPKPHTCGNCPPCHGRGAKGDDYQCIDNSYGASSCGNDGGTASGQTRDCKGNHLTSTKRAEQRAEGRLEAGSSNFGHK